MANQGIGGAERLIVDAAIGLQQAGHKVEIYTSYYDKNRAFSETLDLQVTVAGNLFNTNRFKVLLAVIKSWILGLYILGRVILRHSRYNILVVDQVSASIPILRLTGARIMFYGHYPDQLLTDRQSFMKRLYRYPFDILEEATTKMADYIVVNSKFTQSVFMSQFGISPQVLHPAINTEQYQKNQEMNLNLMENTILSINRFERKKNIQLCIQVLAELRNSNFGLFATTGLVLAGGYDEKLAENKEYLEELIHLCKESDLSFTTNVAETAHVKFFCSFTESQRSALLNQSKLLLYSPSKEHFGIVPLEAMFSGLPVIACNSGGPIETVVNGETGYLCEPNPIEFAAKAELLLLNEKGRVEMGLAGHKRVVDNFSLPIFTQKFELALDACSNAERKFKFNSLIWFTIVIVIISHLL